MLQFAFMLEINEKRKRRDADVYIYQNLESRCKNFFLKCSKGEI